MKRKVASGDLAVVDVVVSCPWEAHSMEVGDLLMSQKRWGLPAADGCWCPLACRRTRRLERSRSASASPSRANCSPASARCTGRPRFSRPHVVPAT